MSFLCYIVGLLVQKRWTWAKVSDNDLLQRRCNHLTLHHGKPLFLSSRIPQRWLKFNTYTTLCIMWHVTVWLCSACKINTMQVVFDSLTLCFWNSAIMIISLLLLSGKVITVSKSCIIVMSHNNIIIIIVIHELIFWLEIN